MAKLILRESGGVGWIIISNLPHRNAVTHAMWSALPEAFDRFASDPKIRLVAMCGDGDEAFVSGGDISEFESMRGTPELDAAFARVVDEGCFAPMSCPKPVLAKIHGFCMGGGLALAASCDLCIAADNAVFAMPAARLGVGYSFKGIERLVQLLGPVNTADIFLSGRRFNAHDALRMGMVANVVARAELNKEFDNYCALIAQNAPLTISSAKAGILAALYGAKPREVEAVEQQAAGCWASNDCIEGRNAFLQKRKPKFNGN